jgi:hypothetical protein
VANWPSTKRALLVLALAGLAVVEIGLLESFIPYEWRHSIHQQTERVFPSAKYDPHPDMDWEFELDYRQHPAHRVVMYAVVTVLVTGVGYLIGKTWRKFRLVR